ncbi:MAG: NAD(P)/FAD-dependent oxidoreductase [Chryseolinea sp.]
MNREIRVGIAGGGLVGCLMALYLIKRGYQVSIFERRGDPRSVKIDHRRSINLALSNRGIKSLEEVGLGDIVRDAAIRMNGRQMHDISGNLTFQPYGKVGEYINSISRADLNNALIIEAEQQGVKFHFDHRCTHVDLQKTELTFHSENETVTEKFDVVLGADGAFSVMRMAMQLTDRFNYTQDYIDHGYKEFHIPPTHDDESPFEKHALHIWPRESFMLIALPNPDNSFTGTLFFPFHGELSFDSLKDPDDFNSFFERSFPDVANLIPDLRYQSEYNPTSSLITVNCYPWHRNKTMLLGDACHAIVPFYGQGMNAGFEDCRILNNLLDDHDDNWNLVMPAFQKLRKPDTDAISRLALENFIEMRDLVGDAEFLLRKKIEAKIHQLYPKQWVPLYSMVTFHDDISYSEALTTGIKQKRIMDEVMKTPNIETTWQSLDFQQILHRMTGD